jgi:hypothetical protein
MFTWRGVTGVSFLDNLLDHREGIGIGIAKPILQNRFIFFG